MKTNYVDDIMYRFPGNKEKTILQIKKLFDLFRNDSIKYDYFKINDTENIPKFTNIIRPLQILLMKYKWICYTRDRNHRNEFVDNLSKNTEYYLNIKN